MPSASYLRQNDYRPQEVRPYQLPYQAALQEMAAKNAFWQQGVAQVQQSYRNVLNLNPQFQQNKEYLKSFMDNASKEIQKLTSQDLSIQDNAARAANIYKGIFDNDLLLKDDQTFKFYQEQEKLSNNARTAVGKNGKQGENWNQANDFYFRTSYNKYLQDAASGDMSKIDQNFQSRKGYIPYYDYSDEVEQAIKNCKPDSQQVTSIGENYLYLNTRSSKGVSAEKMQNCMGFLSDRAKQQIGIDAYQNYYNNRQGLLNEYQDLYVNRSNSQISILDAKIAIAQKAGNQAMVQELQANKNDIQNSLAQNIRSLQDPNFIDQNYERVASQVGFLNWAQRAGQTFSYEEVMNKLSPNAAGIVQFKAQQEERMEGVKFANDQRLLNQRFLQQSELENQKFQYDYQLKEMEKKYDLAKEGMKLDARGNVVSTGDATNIVPVDVPTGPLGETQSFASAVKTANAEAESAAQGLFAAAREYLRSPNISKDVRDALNKMLIPGEKGYTVISNFFQTYDESNQKDPVLDQALANFREKRQKVLSLEDHRQAVTAELKIKVPENNNHTFNLSDMNGPNQTVSFSDRDLVDLNDGKSVRGWRAEGRQGFAPRLISPTGQTIYMAGELKFNGAMNNAVSKMKEYLEEREKALNDSFKSSETFYSTPEITKKQIESRDIKIRNRLSLPTDVLIIQSTQDRSGNSIIKLGKKTKDEGIRPLTQEELAGYNLSGENGYVRVDNLYSPLPDYINTDLNMALVNYTNRSLNELNNNEWAAPRQFTNSSNITFNVKMGKIGDAPVYKVSMYRPSTGWVELNQPITNREMLVQFIENTRR